MEETFICSKCSEQKNADGFSIRKENGKRRKDCKACAVKRTVAYLDRVAPILEHDYSIIDQQYKMCPGCNRSKLGKLFARVSSNKSGLYSYCKQCDGEYSQNRRIENAASRLYTEDNLTSIITKCRKCLLNKPLKEFGKSSKHKNGYDTMCKSCSCHETELRRTSQDGKYTMYKSGAKKRNIEFLLSFDEFMTLWQKPCTYCGSPIQTIGIDRIKNNIGYTSCNITSCCYTCNSMKMDTEYDEWIMRMKLIVSMYDKLHTERASK